MRVLPEAALLPLTNTREYAESVRRSLEAFLTSGFTSLDALDIRPIVRDSWARARGQGVDPENSLAPIQLDDDELAAYRDEHPLARVIGVVRALLGDSAVDGHHLFAVCDAAGRLLWVEGDHSLRGRAESMHFVPGACWTEEVAGTNAPGLALALGEPVSVYSVEHFARNVRPWSCAAAPVRDPVTGALLGAIDLTGGDHIASPHALALVRATVAAVTSELALAALRPGVPAPRGGGSGGSQPQRVDEGTARLEVLGRDQAVLTQAGASRVLSPRHSEILLLLLAHPQGLSAGRLAVELDERELSPVTIRAEMSRLRRILGEHALASQPYRLTTQLRCDALEVRQLLRRGSARRAITASPGPILPGSLAPGIVELRNELQAEMRAVVLRSGNPDLVLALLEHPDQRDQPQLLAAAARWLPPGSPRRGFVEARMSGGSGLLVARR